MFKRFAKWMTIAIAVAYSLSAFPAPSGLIYVDTPTRYVDFAPEQTVADTAGFWILGTTNGESAIARYGNDAVLDYVLYGSYDAGWDDFNVKNAPDGGFFVSSATGDIEFPTCTLSRVGTDGAIRWSQVFTTLYYQRACPILGVDGRGGAWLLAWQVSDDAYVPLIVRVTSDGGKLDGALLDVARSYVFAVDAQLAQAYWIERDAQSATTLVSVDATGTTHTLWQPNDSKTVLTVLVSDSDGNLYAAGSDSSHLVAASFTPTGEVRWTKSYDGSPAQPISAFTARSPGGIALLDDSGTVSLIDANGGLRTATLAQFTSCAAPSTGIGCALVSTAAGDVLVVYNGGSSDAAHPAYVARVPASGAVVSSALGTVNVGSVVALADGSALVGPLFDVSSGVAATPAYARIDNAGHALATPKLNGIVGENGDLIAATQLADGTSFLLTNEAVTNSYALSRVAPDGSRAWKQEVNGAQWNDVAGFGAGTDAVCWAGTIGAEFSARLNCHSASTGALLWSNALPAGAAPITSRTLADDSLVAVYTVHSWSTHHIHLSKEGNVLSDTELGSTFQPYPSTLAINASGMTVLLDHASGSGNVALYAWDANGASLYTVNSSGNLPPPQSQVPESLVLSDDGMAVAAALLGTADHGIWGVDAQGKTLWLKHYDDPNLQQFVILNSASHDNVYFELADFTASPFTYKAIALSLIDGSTVWQTPLPNSTLIDATSLGLGLFDSGLKPDASGHRLVWTFVGRVTQVLLLDADNGNIERSVIRDCETASGCNAFAGEIAGLANDGVLRIAVRTFSSTAGAQAKIYASSSVQPSARIPVTQAGIDGAWYASYASGQGVTIDYIADSHVLFIPWFTFAGGCDFACGSFFAALPNAPSQLAWYSLQGTVDDDATEADLVIAESDPGSFDMGAVGARIVGSAHVSFSDCNNGLLSYQFDNDVNGGRLGAIALTRLSPSTATCKLADGSTLPAQMPNNPANGFDARQSGSWFDPSTSGQGIELTIIPTGENFAGLVFAAWFTFDPAGAADDPQHQHWFTLQGDLSQSSNGKVTLPILQIVGGQFDWEPTSNTSIVGHATLSMHGCDQATLDYVFDDVDAAYSYQQMQGTIPLTKIGGCTAMP